MAESMNSLRLVRVSTLHSPITNGTRMAKPAARLSDTHSCPIPGHSSNPIAVGSPDVLFNNLPAARVGDTSSCGGAISEGEATILVNGKPVAFLGSPTTHGGSIVTGSGNILVGSSVTTATFTAPAPIPNQLDEHFVLSDSDTGLPLANRPYQLKTASGRVIEGLTDEHGKTKCAAAYTAEAVSVEFAPQTEIFIG